MTKKTIDTKRLILGGLGITFIVSLVILQVFAGGGIGISSDSSVTHLFLVNAVTMGDGSLSIQANPAGIVTMVVVSLIVIGILWSTKPKFLYS